MNLIPWRKLQAGLRGDSDDLDTALQHIADNAVPTLSGDIIPSLHVTQRLRIPVGEDMYNTTTNANLDIGNPAIVGDHQTGSTPYTIVDGCNPSNMTGIIKTVALYKQWGGSGAWTVGTYTLIGTNVLQCRDSEDILVSSSQILQTFSVELDVVIGDYIGLYTGTAGIDGRLWSSSGTGKYWKLEDVKLTTPGESGTFTVIDSLILSVGASGDGIYKSSGTIWIEGSALHHIDSTNVERINITSDDISYGIADSNILKIDGTANSGEYAKFTTGGVEGKTGEEVLIDLSGQAGTSFDWNSQDVEGIGTITVSSINAGSLVGALNINSQDVGSVNDITILGTVTVSGGVLSYGTNDGGGTGFRIVLVPNA
jgi:hypothetical protein